MKKLINKPAILFLVSVLMLLSNQIIAQETGKKITKLRYFTINNNVQYLLLESVLKKGKTLTPQPNQSYELYLDSAGTNLIAKVKTDATGKAKAFIPAGLRVAWDASPQHTFIVKSGDEEIISDFIITKAKITLDTVVADGTKSLAVTVTKLENNEWVPAADVELKVGIQRLGGLIPAGEEETYTTDSTGRITAEFKRDGLPGDEHGTLTLAAKVEDNDQFGNLLVQKKAAWGIARKIDHNFFDQRTLWSTRFKTPYWLLFIAYSIIIGVWGTLIYLIRQVVKIIKLGV